MATKKAGSTPAKKSVPPATKAEETSTSKAAAKKTAAKKAPSKKAAAVAEKLPGKTKPPTHAEISERAYSYWEQRGKHHGGHHDDWLRAEKDLQS